MTINHQTQLEELQSLKREHQQAIRDLNKRIEKLQLAKQAQRGRDMEKRAREETEKRRNASVTREELIDWLTNHSGYTSQTIESVPGAQVHKEVSSHYGREIKRRRLTQRMLEIGLETKLKRLGEQVAHVYYKADRQAEAE